MLPCIAQILAYNEITIVCTHLTTVRTHLDEITTVRHVHPEIASLSQKLDRIATELLDLTKLERHNYAILFRLEMGLNNYVSAIFGLDSSGSSAAAGWRSCGVECRGEDDLRFEAGEIKIIKEVRSFTDLGLKEANELVEKRTKTKRTNRKPCSEGDHPDYLKSLIIGSVLFNILVGLKPRSFSPKFPITKSKSRLNRPFCFIFDHSAHFAFFKAELVRRRKEHTQATTTN
ncbi:hypothetical protein Syun_027589 [Stephania yunnanensis]|uniref:Large ribosomal subunit protein bL12 C-terminal domain-containing protein n=1 Tax=Stephania yunnanensis TaxID=152371 RepID=A0AAP0EN61_9MAGN